MLRANILSDLTDVSERLAQMIIIDVILRADILSDLTDMSERLAQMIIVDILY